MLALLLLISSLLGGSLPAAPTLDDACQPDCAVEAPAMVQPPPEPGLSEDELARFRLSGDACYYSDFFEGRRTANGEIFRQAAMTAAHRTLPLGTVVELTSRATGKAITVRINDRGPFGGNFVIDLSRAAARALGVDRARDRHVEIRVVSMPDSERKGDGKRRARSRR